MSDVDFAIVGAGAAGLAAAKVFRAAGKTCTVFEAMDRIGGRAWTESETLGMPFDQGCAWIHAADRNPFFDEAVEAGWTLHHHDMDLDHLYFGRTRADQNQMEDMAATEGLLAERLAGVTLKGVVADDDRVSSLVLADLSHAAVGTFYGPMDFGKDLDEISIADLASAADLDPNYFTREGFGALVARWGSDVAVELSTPVRAIHWDGPDVKLVTDAGSLRADKVLVTVSTGVLAHGGLRFYPDLPEIYDEAFDHLPMGLLTKIPIIIRNERLGKQAFDDLLIERRAKKDIYFLCFPFDLDLMVGFVGGDFAWEMECAGEAAAFDFARQRLERTFGSNIGKSIEKGSMTRWGSNLWTRGAYAAALPGQAAARIVLTNPVAERIFFAGEALAGALKQTCGGARLNGEQTAREMLAA